jgi:uncharacterized protein (TIGR03118 family)
MARVVLDTDVVRPRDGDVARPTHRCIRCSALWSVIWPGEGHGSRDKTLEDIEMTYRVLLMRRTWPWLLGCALAAGSMLATAGYVQTNLTSNIPGLAANLDPNLRNPWGLASSATSPFWAADNGTGLSTLYNFAGTPQALVVTIPPQPGSPPGAVSAPTGVVFNSTAASFALSNGSKATFIFDTENGTIAGWNSGAGTNAITMVTSANAVYKGIAIGGVSASDFLYAANFAAGKIDVFNSLFAPATLAGGFNDPTLPAGYAPFNIENIGGFLYVSYALRDAAGHDDVAGPGHGFVDVFDTNGNLIRRVASGGALNSPWGLALAPANFGDFSNDLLVGNFGDGRINAYDPVTGAFLGQFADRNGNPIAIDGLWALKTHSGVNGFSGNSIYFTAGLNDEADGLYGRLSAVPEPGSLALLGVGAMSLAFIRRRKP